MSAHELRAPSPAWGAGAVRALGWTAAACGAVFVAGLFLAPRGSWTGVLVGFNVLVGLALAGPVGLAFLHLSRAKWSRPLESVPRAMFAALPAAAVVGLVLLFGVSSLYEWSHTSTVAGDPILEAKGAYLNLPFFAVRLVAYFLLWWWAGRAVLRVSAHGAPRPKRLRTAAVFLLVFAPTWSLASVDWLQSLDPHWFSAIYALTTLSGLALSGLAAAVVLIAALDTHDEVDEGRYGDLGAILLSLSLFWGYIWYSQYMLVWYTNMPEETPWYAARLAGNWGVLTKTACVLCGTIPFVLLLFRRLRRSRRALVRIAALVLVGRLVDVWVLAGPPLLGESPSPGIFEIAPVVGQLALFFLLAVRALRSARGGPAVEDQDPIEVVSGTPPVHAAAAA